LEVKVKTAALFINGRSQAVRIPKELEFEGVAEVEISREGDALILRPARKTWTSFADAPLADADFLADRADVVEEGRVVL
jgi:antitoxin VapB